MRAIRFAIAALIATALTVVPVSASFANPAAAKAEMCMGPTDDGCSCCDAQHDPSADTCALKCCSAAAVLAEAQPLAGPRAAGAVDTVAAVLAPFSPAPDPPPPRS
jgi:hypothetical protein